MHNAKLLFTDITALHHYNLVIVYKALFSHI